MSEYTDPGPPEASPGPRAIPRALMVLLVLGLMGYALYALRAVFTPLFLAFFIAYVLDPVVDRFEARGVPRGAGIAIMLALTLGALGLALVLVLPGVIQESLTFAQALPGKLQDWITRLEPTLRELGVPVPHTLDEALASFQVDARQVASSALTPVSTALRWIVGSTASVFGAVAGALMVPLFAFYLLYDFDRIVAAGGDLVPYRHREVVYGMARDVDEVLGHWVRGQFMVMVALSVLYAVGFSLAGVPLAIPIAIVAGMLSFIPYLGGALGLGLALLTCAIEGRIWPSMGYVVVAFGVIQALEGLVVTPKLVGDKVGLSAVVVLVVLMIGNELFGFLGVLLAVPGAAVAKIFVVRGAHLYKSSAFFGAPEDPPEPISAPLGPTLAAPDTPEGDTSAADGASQDVTPAPQPPGADADATERLTEALTVEAAPEAKPAPIPVAEEPVIAQEPAPATESEVQSTS